MTNFRTFSKIAALCLCIAAGTTQMTKAQVTVVNNGSCGASCTYVLTSDSVFRVYGSGDMTNYAGTSTVPWYGSYRNRIKTVIIGDTITRIGNNAFRDCSNLDSVKFGSSVTGTGTYIFYGCTRLQRISIPNTFTTISDYVFTGSGLTSISIPNNIATIGNSAFAGCNGLISVTIGNGVTDIGGAAFGMCGGLTSVTLGNSVASIGGTAFESCSSLPSIIFPNSVRSIGNWAFYGCNNLTSITIPDSVTTISEMVFADCSRLQTVNFNAVNCQMGGLSSSVFGGDTAFTTLNIGNQVKTISSNAFRGCDRLTSVIIPNGVTSIGGWAFAQCSRLISITIPDSVTSIGGYAFFECTNLSSITIPNGVTSIESSTFFMCSNLTSVSIGSSVTSIGGAAFYDCRSLTSITSKPITPPVLGSGNVFNGVPTSIPIYVPCGTMAIYKATPQWSNFTNYVENLSGGITSYTVAVCSLPYTDNNFTNLTQFGTYYDTLQSIKCGDSIICLTLVAASAIPVTNYSAGFCQGKPYTDANFTNLTKAGIYYDTLLTTSGCDSIVCLTLFIDTATIINYSASICQGESYTDSYFSNLTQFGTYYDTLDHGGCGDTIVCLTLFPKIIASGNTGSLTWSLNCDSTFTISGNGAMPNYSSPSFAPWYGSYRNAIKTTIIDSGVTNIGNYAFDHHSNLRSIFIGNSVTWIGELAFSGCDSLRTVSMPNSLTDIRVHAFWSCQSLTSITIPTSVTNIGDVAFRECNKLQTINFNAINCTTMGSSAYPAFWGCTAITTLNIGDGVKTIPAYAFSGGCNTLTSITCRATIPPTVSNVNAFTNVPTSIPVYVPCGSISAYSSASGWDRFTNYYERNIISYMAMTCSFPYTDNYFVNLPQAGTYYDTLQNVSGCDSIIELTLSAYPSVPITNYSASFCQGKSYTDVHFTNLASAGTYYDTLVSVNGCDSVVKLTLTVNSLPNIPIITKNESVLTSTVAESYQWYLDNQPIVGATNRTYTYTQNGQYAVEVANEHGCTAKSAEMTIDDVGIARWRIDNGQLKIYPNPTTGQLTIENGELIIENVEVYDVVGRKLLSQNSPFEGGRGMSEIVIDVSHLPSGVYFLKLNNKIVKIVKN